MHGFESHRRLFVTVATIDVPASALMWLNHRNTFCTPSGIMRILFDATTMFMHARDRHLHNLPVVVLGSDD